jgi:uncharacterized protein YjiS (DUF1127 family)
VNELVEIDAAACGSKVLGHLRHRFFQWRRHVHLCRELMSLSDEELRDIGLSRTEVKIAASKVLWLP